MKTNKLIIIGMIVLISLSFVYAEIDWSDDTYTNFKITEGTPVCQYDDGAGFWIYWNGELIIEEVSDEERNCYKEDGWPSTTCCPEERSCVLNTGSSDFGRCLGGPAPLLCSDYGNKNDCNGFYEEVAIRSVERGTEEGYCGSFMSKVIGDETCYWLIYDCRCEWNDAEGECESAYSQSGLTCEGDSPENFGSCTFSVVDRVGDCSVNDFVEYTWTADWDETEPICTTDFYCEELLGEGFYCKILEGATEGVCADLECKGGTRTISCEDAVKLPFFTITNLIIAVLIICIVYVVWRRSNLK